MISISKEYERKVFQKFKLLSSQQIFQMVFQEGLLNPLLRFHDIAKSSLDYGMSVSSEDKNST